MTDENQAGPATKAELLRHFREHRILSEADAIRHRAASTTGDPRAAMAQQRIASAYADMAWCDRALAGLALLIEPDA